MLRRAAEEVARESGEALSRSLEKMVAASLRAVWSLLPLALSRWDRAVEELAKLDRDPTDEDMLDVLEKLSGEVDIDRAYRAAPAGVRAMVDAAISIAGRVWGDELLERLTPEGLASLAERKDPALAAAMRRCPNLTRRVVEWLRRRV